MKLNVDKKIVLRQLEIADAALQIWKFTVN